MKTTRCQCGGLGGAAGAGATGTGAGGTGAGGIGLAALIRREASGRPCADRNAGNAGLEAHAFDLGRKGRNGPMIPRIEHAVMDDGIGRWPVMNSPSARPAPMPLGDELCAAARSGAISGFEEDMAPLPASIAGSRGARIPRHWMIGTGHGRCRDAAALDHLVARTCRAGRDRRSHAAEQTWPSLASTVERPAWPVGASMQVR